MFLGYQRLVLDTDVWKLAWNRCLSWPMFLWTVAWWDYALFAWSAEFMDVSITTTLYQTWPVLMVALTGWLFRQEARYRRIGPVVYFAFFLAVGGVAVVILSKSDAFSAITGESASTPPLHFALGIFLAFAAACTTAMSAFGFRWTVDFARALPDTLGHSEGSREVFAVMLGILLCNLIAIPFMAIVGLARNEPVALATLMSGLTLVPFMSVIAVLSWRIGNLTTERLGVNVISYFTPLLSLTLLLLFGQVGDVSLTFLFVGAGIIVSANLLVFIQDRSDSQSYGVKSEDVSDVNDLIVSGESDTVEFKSSLRTNLHTLKNDPRMEFAALKTLAAFLNTNGGTLVIGVSDDHNPVGIAVDKFQNEDRMSLHLRNIVNSRTGPLAMSCIHASFNNFEGFRVMVIRCDPSTQPVYVDEGNDGEKFYIRTGPSTTELSISEANSYINDRFRS